MTDANTPILDYQAPGRPTIPPAAWSMLVGGPVLLLLPLLIAPFTDAAFLDFTPMLLVPLGYGVVRRSRAAGSLAMVISALYGLAGVIALSEFDTAVWVGVRQPQAAGRLLLLQQAANTLWGAVTAYLLVRWLWPPSERSNFCRRRVVVWSVGTLYLFAGLGFGLRSWVSTQLERNAPAMTTDLATIDADTGNPLPVTVGGPSIGTKDPWSMAYSAIAPNRMQISWRANKPLPIRVSSPGYVEQEIVLDTDAARLTTVRLRHLPPATTLP